MGAALIAGLGGCAGASSETEQTEYLSETIAAEMTAETETEGFIGESVEEFVGDWRDQAAAAGSAEYETEPETEDEKQVFSDRLQEHLNKTRAHFLNEGYRSDIYCRLMPWLTFLQQDIQYMREADLLPEGSGMNLLKAQLSAQIGDYDGSWSVYMKDLAKEETLLINDEPMRSASIMKLFILGAVYRGIDENVLERDSELIELMSSMVRASSNTAANELVKRLGRGNFLRGLSYVNAYIREEGYSSATHMYNGFEDETLHPHPDKENHTSAADVGLLLERIYHRTFGTRAVCNEVEEWMFAQGTRYKIPKALPSEVLCANKTGETETIENDCALIYTMQGDYILSVMSSNWKDKSLAQERVGEVSASVYEYFKDPEAYIANQLPGLMLDSIANK